MRALAGIGFALLLVLGSGCTKADEGKTVSATDNQFTPNSMNVDQNAKVKWTNDGQALHSVTIHKAGDAVTTTKKDSDIAKGTSTDFTFQETGTFHVYCKYHSAGSTGQFTNGMVMTVTVA